MFDGSVGSPYGTFCIPAVMISTPSAYRERGSRIRVWIAQPWPPCVQDMLTIGSTAPKSASSHTIIADLPPSSRNTRLSVAAPFSMIRLPVTVEPVNEMRSKRGWRVRASPTRWSEAATTLTTPRSEEHTSELQSHSDLVCRLLLEKKKQK